MNGNASARSSSSRGSPRELPADLVLPSGDDDSDPGQDGSELRTVLPGPWTTEARIDNLPIQRSLLIGREREVAETRQLQLQRDIRLVTRIGPGGSGKTRLALEVAASLLDASSSAAQGFEDGVCFVGLAPISDPSLVVSAVAQALDVREGGGQPLQESLRELLRTKPRLISDGAAPGSAPPPDPLPIAMERGRGTGDPDFLKYSGQVVVDLINGDAQDPVAESFEVVIAFGVIFALLLVNRSVDLDDEARPWTCEIDDVRPDGMLPTELPAVEPVVPEHLPKLPLAWRSPSTEIARRRSAPKPSRRSASLVIHHCAVNLASPHTVFGSLPLL